MSLDHTKKTYERLGREDPFYAVLTVPQFRHNKWNEREFFATGEQEIAQMLDYLKPLVPDLKTNRAFDFGCGVGRLTQALADHFDSVVGVDIAESMVSKATQLNRHGSRVVYHANAVDNLELLQDETFDFIYSSITLQHIPPDANRKYISEFFRLLRPGAVVVFQVPNGPPFARGSWREWMYRVKRQYVRRVWKAIRGKPPYEMHYIPRSEVETIVAAAGGEMLDITSFGKGGPDQNFRYCAIKR